jgi:hypothetical protein
MRAAATCLLAVPLLACQPHEEPGPSGGSGISADLSVIADLAGGSCNVEVAAPPDEGAAHVERCAPVTHASKPPASGRHYPQWPVFRVYDRPVPWGYLVHGLEHGVVVIAHNCPDGCADQLAAVKELVANTPSNRACPRPPVIVTPDPTLDVPFAAAAWGYTLRARCFDGERFARFVARLADKGPEFFSSDCGAVDLEAQGWCPAGS